MKKMTYLFCLLFYLCSCSDTADKDFLPEGNEEKDQAEYTISLDVSDLSVAAGERAYLIPTLTKDGERVPAKDYSFSLSTDNGNIAVLNEGADSVICLIGMGEGEANLLVEVEKYKVNATCRVQVAKRTIKVLAIGNSFSDDAIEHYLWDIAKAADVDVVIGNLYIGGCSLATHVQHAEENNNVYSYRKIINGEKTSRENTSLAYGLEDEEWDYVSLQEVSQQSGIYFYYETNLPKLVDFVKQRSPGARLMLHQTWAYAKDSGHSGFGNYNKDQDLMYHSIVSATRQAASLVGIDIIVPAGTAIQNGRTSSLGDAFCRDGYHLETSYGRYTASCTWFNKLFNRTTVGNAYIPNFSAWRANLAQVAASYAVAKPYEVTRLDDFQKQEPELEDTENTAILARPILIDFGGNGANMSPAPWINITDPGVSSRMELTDAGGERTGILFRITKEFGQVNLVGPTATPPAWNLPSTASKDSFWGNDEVPFMNKTTKESEITISSLNKQQKYIYTFFGSRVGATDNRETLYIVEGETKETVSLNTANNLDRIAVTPPVKPNEKGVITITVTHGPQNNNVNKFYYLNAMTMAPAD